MNMTKWKGSISVLLGVILVGVAGCSSTTPTLATEISDFLKVSESMQKELSQSVQTIDKTSEAENSTVHIQQTFGNERELYILYDVTFSEGIDLNVGGEEGILPQTLTLSGEEEAGMWGNKGNVSVFPVATEGQTITYLSYFDSRLDQWPEGDLLFTLGQFEKSGQSEDTIITGEVHEISWSPTNQGTILEGDILSAEGEIIGSVSLSPFSLRFEADSSEQREYTDFLRTIAIVDKNGGVTRAKGSSGGGAVMEPLSHIVGRIELREILDLSNVAAVQIDGHTVTF